MLTDLTYLAYPLPEDIERLVYTGDLSRALRVIEMRLANDKVPQALKNRLRFEERIIREIPLSYNVSEGEMLVQLQSAFRDFTKEDMERLRDEGIRNKVSLVVGGSIRSSADVVKAIALGADACYIGTAALLALGCHLCRSCQTGKCNWGIATQRPDLVKRLNPDIGYKRLVNLVTAWEHEIKEMMGGMGINSIEALRGNRLMLRGVGLNEKELQILGIKHAGE